MRELLSDKTHERNESECRLDRQRHESVLGYLQCRPVSTACSGAETERTCWDPKDGELCLSRMKSEETLMEVRSGSDVQIDRQTWV